MTIETLIDRKINFVSVLEEMPQVAEWLLDDLYLAVVDEELSTIGIVIMADVLDYPLHLLIDCDLNKPRVCSGDSVATVKGLMEQANTPYLPVYDGNIFLGVISLKSILNSAAIQSGYKVR